MFLSNFVSSSLLLSLYAMVLFPATPLVSLICDILMVKEGFHFSFPNQTLEVTFLKSPFKSKKITSSKTLARSSYCVKLMFKSLLTFLIFKVPGSREWLCCFDILSGSKCLVNCFLKKEKTWAEFLSFLAESVAQEVQVLLSLKNSLCINQKRKMHSKRLQQNFKKVIMIDCIKYLIFPIYP